MLHIDNTIISFDVIERKFCCDLKKCKGDCCLIGDSGAPLEDSETKILDKIYPKIKPYLRPTAIETIERIGKFMVDADGDKVTSLIDNKECVYVIYDRGILKCAIEKAFLDKKIKFRKPLSCHLYPIRITKYKDFDAVNFHRNDICKSAMIHGDVINLRTFEFLKEPLVRKYGNRWYRKVKHYADNYHINLP